MNQITFPLKPQTRRPEMADLHEALAFLGFTIGDTERTNQLLGASTRQAVSKFQTEHRLPITGGVDEATAEAINRELAKHDLRPARHQEESAGERLASFVETIN